MINWQNYPFEIQVKKGQTIAFCMCNESKNGPYCDGSHQGSGTTPEVITFEEDKTVIICGCQHSKNAPYCDGTHSELKK